MTPSEGTQLGDYRILAPIGAGGMGQVYLAEHVHLRRKYALKVLPEQLADDTSFVKRFYDEARVRAGRPRRARIDRACFRSPRW